MTTKIGFLKRSQKFRSNVSNGKYIPILDSLHYIASKYQNNLPSSFCINQLYGFSTEDVEFVLSQLYSNRKYSCRLIRDKFFCLIE